jgi:peptide/nickel transport system substrate-binding protein
LLVGLFQSCSDPTIDQNIKVFHYNLQNPVTSLDPAFAKSQTNIWATNQIFNGLVQLDDELQIIPSIAKEWQVSDDGLTYLFALRRDVYFHDNACFTSGKGRQLLAGDVVYSFNRLLSADVNSPGSWIFKDKVDPVHPFAALNDSLFVLKLSSPFRPMLGILTMQYCSVVPSEAVAYYGRDFRSNPVGTGPFKFKRWVENQGLFLIKNPNYFELIDGVKLPLLDGVRTSFIADRKIAYLELLNDRLEFFSGLESSIIQELLDAEGELNPNLKAKVQYIKAPFLNMEYLGINMENQEPNSPLRNKKIRQALNFALDKSLMLKTLRNNVGKPANAGFIPYGLPSFNPEEVKGYSYNPQKAAVLLEEAGYPNGADMPTIKLYTNKDYVDLTTFAARQWEDIGIPVQIELLESASLRDGMRKGGISFFRASWIADYPDGESFLCMFYSKNPAPPNYTRFKDEKFDRLYEQAIKENDEKKRIAMYQEMDRIIVEEAPVIFLFYDETAIFASPRIEQISKNAMNLLQTKQLIER